jgi:hypothetical protein
MALVLTAYSNVITGIGVGMKQCGNDKLESDTDDEKSVHRKQNHQNENMSISIDNGTSNRKGSVIR